MKEFEAPGGPMYVWDEQEEISIYGVLRPLVRHWRTILSFTLAFAGIAVAYSLIRPPSYTSTAKFYAQTKEDSPLSSLSGVAAQFGIPVGDQKAGESPEFYSDLLETERIVEATVRTSYTIEDSLAEGDQPVMGNLVKIFRIDGETPGIRLERARAYLKEEVLDVETDSETGVITASITTSWPSLSAAIGERMLELLNDFNLETRQSQAAKERRFIEERLEESRQDLLAAEDSLQRFLERTRQFGTSPTFTFQRDRLRRQVDLRQQLYTSLAESHQKARIEEVRDVPVITVIDPPTVPVRADDSRVLLLLVLGLMLGAMIGTGVAYGRAFLERSKEKGDEEYDDLVQEFRRAFEGPRRVARRVRSVLPGSLEPTKE